MNAHKRSHGIILVLAPAVALLPLTSSSGSGGRPQRARAPGIWTLSWSDEFSGANGSRPDPAKWTYDVGGNGWGNNELECYTNSLQNAYVQDGNLVIKATALSSPASCTPDGSMRSYTSARLTTRGLFSQAYGRFEARIKIPGGQGMWPAFWLLGNNLTRVNWPACGEIDIMENVGKRPSTIYGSIHGPDYSGRSGLHSAYHLPADRNFTEDFHVFAVEWEPNIVRFYVDNTPYHAYVPRELPSGGVWAFDHPFFIILNVAVGGNWPGPPDATTIFPQTMLVDYVRVYTHST